MKQKFNEGFGNGAPQEGTKDSRIDPIQVIKPDGNGTRPPKRPYV